MTATISPTEIILENIKGKKLYKNPLTEYPSLEIEEESEFDPQLIKFFQRVSSLKRAWDAKKVIYVDIPEMESKGLAIGGGSNHIWFHRVNNGVIDPKRRIAIIYFDPYEA